MENSPIFPPDELLPFILLSRPNFLSRTKLTSEGSCSSWFFVSLLLGKEENTLTAASMSLLEP